MLTRQECIDVLYQKVKCEIPISRGAYEKSLDDWVVEPMMMDGERIGVIITCDNEIHMHITKEKALRHARRIIRFYVAQKLNQLDFLTTRSRGGEWDDRFLKRLGFYETWQSGLTKFYRLDQLAIK